MVVGARLLATLEMYSVFRNQETCGAEGAPAECPFIRESDARSPSMKASLGSTGGISFGPGFSSAGQEDN